MSSERRILTKTPEGKPASSGNGLRHSPLSKTVVVSGESREDFATLLASFLNEHQPETPTERALVENMAVARWRQIRIWGIETTRFNQGTRLVFGSLTGLNRSEVHYDRQFKSSLDTLQRLRAERRDGRPPDRPGPPAAPIRLVQPKKTGQPVRPVAVAAPRFTPELIVLAPAA